MKKLLKIMDNPHAGNNSVLNQVEKKLEELEDKSPNATSSVLNLMSHKKKAILATIPKLSSVTGSTYSMSNICYRDAPLNYSRQGLPLNIIKINYLKKGSSTPL